MSEAAERLKLQISQLSSEDREELAQFLIHSLDQGTDEEVEAAWEAELRERLCEIRSGKVIGEPADKVFAELREKHA
jgi:putative addiction module component (TIGR02574 family)